MGAANRIRINEINTMSYLIAITGKGGVGKTTIAAIFVKRLIVHNCHPVLAIDADPNTCLDEALGVSVKKSVGTVREEARQIAGGGISGGITKQQLLELKIAESLVEAEKFDLIAMGRPEGPGCYCYANNVLKEVLSELSSHYPYVVLDNEAGLENLSRRIIRKVDLLVMVSDPSQKGLQTVHRLYNLAREMEIKYGKLAIIVNRMRNCKLPAGISELKTATASDYVIDICDDPELTGFAEKGRSIISLPEGNIVSKQIDSFITEIGL